MYLPNTRANTVYIPEWFTAWPLSCPPPPPHFGWPKMNFDHISRHFREIRNFYFFSQNGCPKITFDRISRHFRPIRNFDFFHKMAAGGHFGSPIWAILDDRKSLSITFLAFSDQYTTFFFLIFFSKCGHFGSPICAKNNRVLPLCVINDYTKYEVDRWICDTVKRCHKLFEHFYTKWPPEPILFFRLMTKIIGFL